MTVTRLRLDRLPARSAESPPAGVPIERSRSSKVLRYELNVVAAATADLVSGLGGWLFDRRMAGWSVGVASVDHGDNRALQILGVKTIELNGVWRSLPGDPEGVALTVIASDRFESDETVRTPGLEALRGGTGEIAFWGRHCPDSLARQFRRTQYCPSAAARSFKAHALAAAGHPTPGSGLPETVFRSGTVGGVLDTDLLPVR